MTTIPAGIPAGFPASTAPALTDEQWATLVRARATDPQAITKAYAERRRPASVQTGVVAELSRITTLHPRNYNEARLVGENYRDGTPVIMNLSEMDDNDAKRLVDFAAGLIFAVHGSIDRVTAKVFLLCPPNVEVGMEEKATLVENGFFNQS